MPLVHVRRLIRSGGAPRICPVPIRADEIEILEVRAMACRAPVIRPDIVQGAEKTFHFRDLPGEDFTEATEITFDVWERTIAGDVLLSYSLSGSTVTLVNARTFAVTVTNAQSLALPKGRHHCEAWVTRSSGARLCVGRGWMLVHDSRKHDV